MSDSGDLPSQRAEAAIAAAAAAAVDQTDPSCEVAHGHAPAPAGASRTLVAVFDTPVARFLLSYARDTNYRAVLLEPDASKPAAAADGVELVRDVDGEVDGGTDIVVTDHHRPELGIVLRDALKSPARWVGVMGNPRHPGPHIAALTALGVPGEEIARVHRPIGLNIGSRTPAEIALSTMAGLIADRNQRAGGFTF
ncbi:MAG TPA: XdhC family protein [Streptosporangiaceae bacterium]|jgi:xanthine/CO dehydrogenase XdhC/CoxF family maturation factor